jgi:flagellar basal body-associated protein FliL
MKRRALLKLTLTLALALGALASAVYIFQASSATARADSAAPANNSDRAKEPVPMTDRIPWLIYIVLTSSTVALAWILFSLARARMRDLPRDEKKQP